MKNYLLYLLKSKLIIEVSGKNISNFIKKLRNNNIDILNIKYSDKVLITIYKSDYEKLINIKTIYDINIIDYKGFIKLKRIIKYNLVIIILLILSVFFIHVLSNIIFSIDVVTNDLKFKTILLDELNKQGVRKNSFKKNYNDLIKVKENILNKFKDKIEWIEIDTIGTKYIVKYEPRIINKKEENYTYRNIIAKKDAVITRIIASSGEIVKNINTYVKKGDVIVSGKIYLNEELKTIKDTSGTIYGEVWYKVNIKYPYKYYEIRETGNSNNILSIVFLNHRYSILKKYNTSILDDKIIMKENILPIFISLTKEKETVVINENNNYEKVIDKAILKSKEKINSNLKENEYIKDYKILSKNNTEDYVELTIFFAVIENITEYEEIIE